MIKIFSINKNKLEETKEIDKKQKYWIDLELPLKEEFEKIAKEFEIHPTTQEDVLSNQTRIKYEEFDENTVIIFRTINLNQDSTFNNHNLSFIIGKNYLISIHSEKNEHIEHLQKNPKKIEALLKKGSDIILHHLIDKEMDKHMHIKNTISEEFKEIEKEFMKNQEKKILEKLLKKELLILELRQKMESLTDICLQLTKPTEDNYIKNDSLPYFRDVYDHSFKITESLKNILGRINGMRNSYQSIISNKMNETMKILTMIMAIMMPITIITGFYGMNVSLPFQENPNIWIYTLFILGLISLFMYLIFRKLRNLE